MNLFHVRRYNGTSYSARGSFDSVKVRACETSKNTGATAFVYDAKCERELGRTVFDATKRVWTFKAK